jgi:V/A-type H+-transporting ATPase subunit K
MDHRERDVKGDMRLKYGLAFALWVLLFLFAGVELASAQEMEEVVVTGITDGAWLGLATAATMIGATLAAGWAISATGVAAAGVTAEKPEAFGRVLIFVALAEALAIYGLLIAFMLWTKI